MSSTLSNCVCIYIYIYVCVSVFMYIACIHTQPEAEWQSDNSLSLPLVDSLFALVYIHLLFICLK